MQGKGTFHPLSNLNIEIWRALIRVLAFTLNDIFRFFTHLWENINWAENLKTRSNSRNFKEEKNRKLYQWRREKKEDSNMVRDKFWIRLVLGF